MSVYKDKNSNYFKKIFFQKEKPCRSKTFHYLKMRSGCTVILLVLLFLQSHHSVHGQWAQTIGWGGAGNGKRNSVPSQTGQCYIDPNIFDDILKILQVRNGHCLVHFKVFLGLLIIESATI